MHGILRVIVHGGARTALLLPVVFMSALRQRTACFKQLAKRSVPLLCFLAATLLIGVDQTLANDDPVYDQYSLQATAEGEVENDLMIVRLQVEHEDRDTAALANRVNQDMQWALDQLDETQALQYRTENYRTYPKYEQNRIVGWRSSQVLTVSGADFDELKNVVQVLQQRLQVADMSFRPSDDTRSEVEDTLINEALDNFKRRAEIVQANMQASGYRVMHLEIQTPGSRGGSGQLRAEMMAVQSRSGGQSPAIEAGETRITVSVSGQIQLQ